MWVHAFGVEANTFARFRAIALIYKAGFIECAFETDPQAHAFLSAFS